MAILGFELDEIAKQIRLLEESGLDEICIVEETRYLRVKGPRKQAAAPMYVTAPQPQAAAPVQRALPPAAPAPVADENQIVLTSPMMGMFYRAEKPGAPPLVNVGQHVSVGQPIGIIEAMKIFSEVLAEQSGVVVAVPADDGTLVQAGAPLIILRKE
jgi:acetyl-CoA carboxylase biotin carboxyl carrier protein